MDFKQAQDNYIQLRARFESGELSEEEFKSELLNNMVMDEQGVWWVIGYETGRWHRHDGTDWVPAEPPGMTSPQEQLATPVEQVHVPAQLKPSTPVPPKKGFPRLWLGIGAAGIVALVALCALAIKFYPGGLIVVNTPENPTPAATEGPGSSKTPAAETPAGISEEDIANTLDAASVTNIPPADSQVLFQDDFSDPSSGWITYSDANAQVYYAASNEFVIQARKPNEDIWSVAGQNFADASLEVDAVKSGGPDNNNFGLICRYQDDNNFYFFIISSGGREVIGKYQGGSTQNLSSTDMQIAEAIHVGDTANHLRADCIGDALTLYVNDQQVDSVTDTTFTSGDVGLLAGTFSAPFVDIAFDNFVVYSAGHAGALAASDTPTTAGLAADPNIIFQDDFSTSDGPWVVELGSPEEASLTADRQYRLLAGSVAYAEELARLTGDFTDVRIDVDVTPGEGNGTIGGKYGLVCRYQDASNFYLFMIDWAQGYYWIGRRNGNDNRSFQNWMRIPRATIYNGSPTVHLRAECAGSTLTFYVNGEEQGSVSDTSLSHGSVGLIVLAADVPDADFLFDNFIVSQP